MKEVIKIYELKIEKWESACGSHWDLCTFCHQCNGYVLLLNALGLITDLPHANDGISDEDKKDNKRLHEGSHGLLTFLEPGQHLRWER